MMLIYIAILCADISELYSFYLQLICQFLLVISAVGGQLNMYSRLDRVFIYLYFTLHCIFEIIREK